MNLFLSYSILSEYYSFCSLCLVIAGFQNLEYYFIDNDVHILDKYVNFIYLLPFEMVRK